MGTNKTDDYAAAVRAGQDMLSLEIKDSELIPYFEGSASCDFKPEFIEKNDRSKRTVSRRAPSPLLVRRPTKSPMLSKK